jgi:hypothetical protein
MIFSKTISDHWRISVSGFPIGQMTKHISSGKISPSVYEVDYNHDIINLMGRTDISLIPLATGFDEKIGEVISAALPSIQRYFSLSEITLEF